MIRTSLLALALLSTGAATAFAQSQEALNELTLVISIPIYAGNCSLPLDDTTMANIEAKIGEIKENIGVNDAQVEDIANQLTQQIGSASCEPGSDERNAFDESVKAYTGE